MGLERGWPDGVFTFTNVTQKALAYVNYRMILLVTFENGDVKKFAGNKENLAVHAHYNLEFDANGKLLYMYGPAGSRERAARVVLKPGGKMLLRNWPVASRPYFRLQYWRQYGIKQVDLRVEYEVGDPWGYEASRSQVFRDLKLKN